MEGNNLMKRTLNDLKYHPLNKDNKELCERCIVTYGINNARIATMALERILIPDSYRLLCEPHFFQSVYYKE